jgi:hypothetical protein
MSKELYSDSNTSLELEYAFNNDSTTMSNREEVDLRENVEPKLSAPNYITPTPLTLEAQLRDRIDKARLAQL